MRSRALVAALILGAAAWSVVAQENTQTLLERQLYYVANGKIGQTKYWYLYLGAHDCKLRRKFPGEDTTVVQASVSFSLKSSGYVAGSGLATNGKRVDCLVGFAFATEDTSYKLPIDSVAYAYRNCDMVVTTDGKTGYLRIDAEGTLAQPSDLLLTSFKMVTEYGEKVLRKDVDVTITAFAFTKEGIQKALKAGASAK
jgi:hypothetical protein